ncbi:MAG: purine-nucleoside phosphorylase [Firmicutes bacterium]|nr:purine-nucleoside phosphorylase [Bacillota bacterium]
MEYSEILKSVKYIQAKVNFTPKIAVVLGSGLSGFAETIEVKHTLSYADIPNFPVSTVKGHAGRFVFGYIDNIPLILMQGRFHYYEGYSPSEVVLGIRVMRQLGAEILILTNASGGISFPVGSFMGIKDHISNFAPNPLVGKNIDKLGERFFDMSKTYDENLIEIFFESAKENNINFKTGVYIQLTGPSFETPAEIRMCKTLGADAVGMSTVTEAIAAKHCGFKICGISFITNAAANENTNLNHQEVIINAGKYGEKFKNLLTCAIKKMKGLVSK